MGVLVTCFMFAMYFLALFLILLVPHTTLALPNQRNKVIGFFPESQSVTNPRVAGLLEPCPSGCCPFASWYCCEDNRSCAVSLEECPPVVEIQTYQLNSNTARANLEPCPSGCCPFAGWYCCENNKLCAKNPEDCPAAELTKVV